MGRLKRKASKSKLLTKAYYEFQTRELTEMHCNGGRNDEPYVENQGF
jgi:hypothetical protein